MKKIKTYRRDAQKKITVIFSLRASASLHLCGGFVKTMTDEEYNRLSGIILDCCITVHKEMGPGLLESVYEWCLMKEFELRGVYQRIR